MLYWVQSRLSHGLDSPMASDSLWDGGPSLEGKAASLLSETWDFYLVYLDSLVALSEAREERDRLGRENVALLNDPLVQMRVGVWGRITKPLSEWTSLADEFEEQWGPAFATIGVDVSAMERPWEKAIRAWRKRRDWKHARPNGTHP